MNLLERIQLLAAQHDTTLAALDRDCGFSHGTIRRWGSVAPSVDKVCSVAVRLNVSIDYLCGITDSANDRSFIPSDQHLYDLSPDEKQIVGIFRSLSTNRQDNVLSYIEDQCKLSKAESKKGKTVV